MKKNIKRVLSLALVFCLALVMSINVYATGDTETETTAIETEADSGTVETVDGEITETEAEETVANGGISLASANDGIATVSDDDDETTESTTESVTVYTNATATVSFDTTTQLVAETDYTASGSIYAMDDSTKEIATYTVTETENSGYTYSLTNGTTAVTSMSAGYYVIGTSGNYLAVDSDGNLTTSSTIGASSVWIVTGSSNDGYTIQNASTGAYLTYTTTGSGPAQTYSLAVSDSEYTWPWSSTYGFYFTTQGGPDNSTTYRYITTSGGLSSTTNNNADSKASLYAVTATAGDTTTYTYTVTITGVVVGTGTLALTESISIDVTVEVSKYTKSGLNISYGWHVANIETFTSNSNTYVAAVAASIQAMKSSLSSYTNIGSGYITAQYNSSSQGSTASYVSLGAVYGYDADVYYSDSTDGVYSLDDLNVNVYGSDETGTGTSGATLTMAQSTGEVTTKTQTSTDGNGNNITFTISDYEENTIYDYNYITIVPENGYYVSNIVIGCAGSLEAAAGSPYAETSENIEFTNENGNDDLFGAYGVGCTSMSKGSLSTESYDPTTGTSVELDMSEWIESHAEDAGVEDPYFILIEIEKIPTPLYVEYEAGDAASYVDNATIVSTNENYYWATESAGDNVSFALDSDDLEDINYLYTVLDPAYTTYTDNNGTVYYFAGWEVTYYTTAADYGTEENQTYPTLSGTVTLASGTIDYGSGTTLYLFTHVKLVAKWSTNKADVNYVVDFGLPMELDLINTLGVKSSSSDASGAVLDYGYTWTVTAIASHPNYGTATIASDGSDVTYTLTDVMDGTDTMLVWLTGAPTATDTNAMNVYGVVEVTIYPATTVYYEEGFATYGTGSSVDTESKNGWSSTGSTGSVTQEAHVANVTGKNYNDYGYDGAYAGTTAESNGTQAATETATDSLSFSFTGTGVDIYANCTSSTGTVLIRVTQNGSSVKMLTVNTSEVGTYAETTSTSYNTPIASITGLEHGTYDVLVYVTSLGNSKVFNFDGFRVYDTINNKKSETSGDAYDIQTSVYKTDKEDYPDYTEIRDVVLTALIGSADENATITEDYVDSMSIGDAQVYASKDTGVAVYYNYSETGSNYVNWSDLINLMDDGAKNELYLPEGVTLVLALDESEVNRVVQIGVKGINGTANVSLNTDNEDGVTVSTVDMFYTASVDTKTVTVTDDEGNESTSYVHTVTISNTGSSTISLTKLKACDEPISISSEAITESEMTALLTGTDDTDDTEVEEEAAVFEPETFNVSTSVKTSNKSAAVTVTAKASEDVEAITVNGVEVTDYKTVTERTGMGRNATTTTYRQFTYTETVTESGTYTYEVTAVNADGTASVAETATATVTIRSVNNGKR